MVGRALIRRLTDIVEASELIRSEMDGVIPTGVDVDSYRQGSKHFFFGHAEGVLFARQKKQKTFIPWHSASRCNLRGCQPGFTAIGEKFFASFVVRIARLRHDKKRSACFLASMGQCQRRLV